MPHYQSELDSWKEIKKLISEIPNNLEYLEHLDYAESRIMGSESAIKHESRREFIQAFYDN